MVRVCERCGGEVVVSARGRLPRYCSNACRQAAYRTRKLPGAMTERTRWVRWTYSRRGPGKATKVPLTTTGRPASSTDPSTWRSYSRARTAAVGEGLGFVLGDGIGCIDLDNALHPDGKAKAWAARILAGIPATYIEISPSGQGLHIFGLLPEGRGRVIRDHRAVEVYSTGRYITVTARPYARAVPALADLTGVVASL